MPKILCNSGGGSFQIILSWLSQALEGGKHPLPCSPHHPNCQVGGNYACLRWQGCWCHCSAVPGWVPTPHCWTVQHGGEGVGYGHEREYAGRLGGLLSSQLEMGEPAWVMTSLSVLAMFIASLCAGVGLGVGLAGLRASGGYCPE